MCSFMQIQHFLFGMTKLENSWDKKIADNLPQWPKFVQTGTSLPLSDPPFLSEPGLGLEPKSVKFCPNRDLASKGTIRGPI